MDTKHFWPKVVQVLPTDDFEVYAYLNDGSVRLYDVKPLMKENTVFEPLMDIQTFKGKLTVINDTIAWDMGGNRDPYKCIDIDPVTVYGKTPVVDPLTNMADL
ncbi:MAG: DUF2442 domain-containing protein [Treponema sp.]|jgi:hypothetical protein|nr:DUF2442 domain-containing protein [Treponema sp.]